MQSHKNYHDFISDKHFKINKSGFEYKTDKGWLFDYQKACVEWACKRGKSALFLDTGLGKTNCELEWANAVSMHTGMPVLILAPLCVSLQIKREGEKYGFSTTIIREDSDVKDGINIANYEILHKLDPRKFSGVVLDESSILKGMNGKMRKLITEAFKHTQYKLSASATPSPNDYMELGTQSEFLGIMSQVEMLATFFIHDGGDTAKWRLKGHGKKKFFEWLATWAIIMRDPSVFGFASKPILPPLEIIQITIDSGITDGLLPAIAQSLQDRQSARRNTIDARAESAAQIANALDEPCLLWCGLNNEGDELEKLIDNSVQVSGADKDKDKESRMIGFSDGEHRVLITKPKIAGFGMNWQHCSKMIFVGLSDSFEQYYQAVRRCWRYGQQKPVTVYVVTADIEGAVVANIKRKEEQAEAMLTEMALIAAECFTSFEKAENGITVYNPKVTAPLPSWRKSCK